ncbi:IK cytokine [Entomortierella parvispora]|uniref:IK cytokine n=1 Tax=Entomortierella parvispora TaxID=205924 RepID=A0A9P3LZ80_9FUNG|nr:IK cytokine [Entomortierella parvispora]
MSNPMPPPDFKPPAEKKDGGLSQDDFRKLLATPRAAPGGAGGIGGSFTGGGMRALGMANRTARAPVPQTPRSSESSANKWKHKKQSQKHPAKEAAAAGSKYRDRATERRQGVNPDYVETEQILNTLEGAAADVAPEVLYEQSKYLGGDREHTHLVKGLDFALLNKVRQEGQEDDTDAEAAMDLDTVFETVEKAKKEEAAEAIVIEAKPEMESILASGIYKYAIEEAGKKPPKVNEMFIPGRTVFVFQVPITSKSKRSKAGVVEDDNPFVVPTTVVRSRADVDQNQSGEVENPENDMVMKKVLDVLQAIRTGERKAGEQEAEMKAKKKAAAAAAARAAASRMQTEDTLPPLQPDLDGDDIFADAGTDYVVEPVYVPATSAPEDAADQGPMVGPARPDNVDMSNYFDEDSDADQEDGEREAAPNVDESSVDPNAPVLGPSRPSDGDMAGYFDEDSEQENSDNEEEVQFQALADQDRSKDREELAAANSMYTTPLNENALPRRKPTLDSMDVDEDADYYSAYGLGTSGRGLGSTAYDSDDDEDEGQSTILIDKGTHKNKRAQLGRFDFDTEEGFNRYKDTVEVIPKTSFQFGVKMSEGRKTGKWDEGKNKGLSKDEKLDRDWQRISRLMEKNRGGGSKGEAGSSGGNAGGGGENRAKRRKNNR